MQVELGDEDDDDQDRDGRNNLEQVELRTVVKLVRLHEIIPFSSGIILEAESLWASSFTSEVSEVSFTKWNGRNLAGFEVSHPPPCIK